MADATKKIVLQAPPFSGVLASGGVFEMWQVFDAELVDQTAVVDSVLSDSVKGFRLDQFHFFGLWIQATSTSGTADVDIQIVQSYNDTAANYVVPNTGGTMASSVSDEAAHVYSVSPVPMPFLRFRVTGVGSNPADTVVTAFAWFQD